MGKPKSQPPPDPVAVSQAQSQSNIATAQEQQRLNMINTQGPQGSVQYRADPSAPGGYSQITSLSPAEQQTYNLQKQAENGALGTANTQLGRVNEALATPLTTAGLPDLRGAPQAGAIANGYDPGGQIRTGFDPGGQVQTGFDKGQSLQYGFDPGQQVQGQVGAQDLYAAAKQAQDASYGQATSRLDPQYEQLDNQLRTRLANQGLSQNSDAYQTADQNFGRTRNDAYAGARNDAVTQGNAAAQQLFQQSLQQGQFANQAAGQQYAQNQGQAAFGNQTAAQDYSQNLGAAQFGNTAQQQQFGQNQTQAQFANEGQAAQNAQNQQAAGFANTAQQQAYGQGVTGAGLDNQARNQGLQERAYIQNQPINQFTGLLGLGQVGQPQGIQYTPSQVANTDVLGAYALNAQAAQAQAAQKQSAQNGLMSGLFSLGSAAIMSDRRLKQDIRLLRRRPDGIGVYAYRYLWDGPEVVRTGVMADEVKKVRPDLVLNRPDGFKAVFYHGLEAA